MGALPRMAPLGDYTGLHIAAVTPTVSTTGQPAIAGAGTLPMTPASMTNIAVGTLLTVDTAGSQEVVQVLSEVTVNTTSSAIGATGSQVNTPASMAGIVVGAYLSIDTAANQENVVVTAVTATTFTATYTKTHLAGVAIAATYFTAAFTKAHAAGVALAATKYVGVGRVIAASAVATGPITAGLGVTVTLDDLTVLSGGALNSGMHLYVTGGTGTAEAITVRQVNRTAGTFVADFAFNHSGPYFFYSLGDTHLGPLTINTHGTTDVFTLYNGHPNNGGSILAVVGVQAGVPAYPFALEVPSGLWYTLTGTAGDYTLHYADRMVGG